jgi:Arc/MetJ-type ribon-helix-helix transcriptional regulator
MPDSGPVDPIDLPSTWMVLGWSMRSDPVPAPRSRPPESEKITLNLGFVDLGQIDLLVAEGFYGNRSDFIRAAIRQQLVRHGEAVGQAVARRTLVLGLQRFEAADLRAVQAAGERLRIRVLGLAVIADDVSAELALATIESVQVLGAFHASPAVRDALAARLR